MEKIKKIIAFISDLISDLTRRISSRKFQALIISCFMHYHNPLHFTGNHLVIVLCVYIGGNVLEKMIDVLIAFAGRGK